MTVAKTHILIVEDEPAIVELLTYTLNNVGWTISAVANTEDAWKHIHTARPHLILLDWMLPDRTGIQLLSRIRGERAISDIPVIMLTAKSMEEDKITGLENGADDYVTKPFSPRELNARVNALLRRRSPEHANGILQVGPLSLNSHSCTVNDQSETFDVGLSEFRLLKFLMSYPGRVYTRAQLLDKVWGDHSIIEERTVDVHILRLRKAIKGHGQMIRTVRGMGYKLALDGE